MTTPQRSQNGQPSGMRLDPSALVGLVLAVAGIGVAFVPLLSRISLVVALAALVTSIVAMARIDQSGGSLRGKGIAMTGVVISAVWLILAGYFIGRTLIGG